MVRESNAGDEERGWGAETSGVLNNCCDNK